VPLTFLGSTVSSYSAAVGWGSQVGQLNLTLVDDPANADSFTPGTIGTPKYFSSGTGFTFNGILQKFERVRSVRGNPVYEVVIHDPREILDAAQVVLGNYNGVTNAVANCLNVFGYQEVTNGFGSSGANESGMSWNLVKSTLTTLLAGGTSGDFGGPLSFKGTTYTVDLSQMPSAPDTYRVGGGVSMSLLELISLVCEDGGSDYFVDLVGTSIRVRTVSRTSSPALGTLQPYVDANYGVDLVANRVGEELRNEQTSSFLVGGPVTDLYMSTSGLKQFWGYDISGVPILGRRDTKWWEPNWQGAGGAPKNSPHPVKFAQAQPADPDANWTYQAVTGYLYERMSLNASPVSDVVGGGEYECFDLEMRLALQGYDSWAAFVESHKSWISPKVFSQWRPPFAKAANNDVWAKKDVVNDGDAALANAVNNEKFAGSIRLYELVRLSAEEYLGKTYVVPADFLKSYTDPETGQVHWNWEVTDGGYLPEGSSPLGLEAWDEDKLTSQDGRFRCFVKYTPISGADLSSLDPASDVVEDPNAFVSAQAEGGVVPTEPDPSFLVRIARPLRDKANDTVGVQDEILRAAFQARPQEDRAKGLLRGIGGFHDNSVVPAFRAPTAAAVPVQSNVDTYGPWTATGAAGKVRVDQDGSLVPWNYGGFSFLDAAATARVTSSLTNTQVVEAGEVERAGAPAASLGDVLSAGGPNITNVDVRYGTGGITTTYGFRLYTPHPYRFSRGNAERLRRVGAGLHNLDRASRAFARENMAAVDAEAGQQGGGGGNRAFAESAPKAVRRQSPHDYLVSTATLETGNWRVSCPVTSATAEEALAMIYPDDPTGYKTSAAASLDTLFMPFSTLPFPPTGGVTRQMAQYRDTVDVTPLAPASTATRFDRNTLNPWRANGVWQNAAGFTRNNAYDTGDGLSWQNTGLLPTGVTEVRAVALRAPVMVAGWGFDANRLQVGPGGSSALYKTQVSGWRAGPVDMHWDEMRGVWTSRDVMLGRVESTGTWDQKINQYPYAGGASGFRLQNVADGNGARTWMGPVQSGDLVLATYAHNAHQWVASRGPYPAFGTSIEQVRPIGYGPAVPTGTLPTPISDVWSMGAAVATPSGMQNFFGGGAKLYGDYAVHQGVTDSSCPPTRIFVNDQASATGLPTSTQRRTSSTFYQTDTTPAGGGALGLQFQEGFLMRGPGDSDYTAASGAVLFVYGNAILAVPPTSSTGTNVVLKWNTSRRCPEWGTLP
jgi:hypothetical protein